MIPTVNNLTTTYENIVCRTKFIRIHRIGNTDRDIDAGK